MSLWLRQAAIFTTETQRTQRKHREEFQEDARETQRMRRDFDYEAKKYPQISQITFCSPERAVIEPAAGIVVICEICGCENQEIVLAFCLHGRQLFLELLYLVFNGRFEVRILKSRR